MSLPTYAKFYNKDDNIIAKHFVNVGWWLDEENFSDAVMELPWIRDAEYCILYGITITKKFLIEPKTTDWKKYRESIIENTQNNLPEWNIENNDLKLAVREYYIECNKNEQR